LREVPDVKRARATRPWWWYVLVAIGLVFGRPLHRADRRGDVRHARRQTVTYQDRRKQPGRGHDGRRSTVRGWLVDHGMRVNEAEAWCDAWEKVVIARDVHPEDPVYWTGATTWIVEQRKTRRSP
jgi:hypothetical protein